MSLRHIRKSLFLSSAALLTVFAVADSAHAIPKGPIDPTDPDPIIDPPAPTKPPIVKPPPVSCVAPTTKDCQDPTYLESTCGKQNKQACGDLIAPLYKSEVGAVSQTTQILKPIGGFDRFATAKRLDPIAMPERKFTFGTLSFSTASQLGRTKPPYADTANTTPQHPDYEANGATVASCQEYAYESLYDQERWAEAAETCGSNDECVYQLSLMTSTPGLKAQMLKKNGQPQAIQPVRTGAYSVLKNAFFARAEDLRSHPDYASNPTFRAKIDQIIAHVQGTPKINEASELGWHRKMHDAFALNPLTSAELASIKSRVDQYSYAEGQVGAANFAIALLEAVLPGQQPADQANTLALLNQYKQQKATNVATMARLAVAEWDRVDPATGVADRGCLSRTGIKCDWSPKRFRGRYAGHPRNTSEDLFNACVDATGGNFAKVPASFRTDTDALAAWIAAQSLPKLGTTTVGQRMNDGDEWGDRQWFAAGYGYDVGWQLAADRQSGSNRICKLKGNAYAQASANAWALNQQVPVLDTRHKLSVRESGDTISFHSHLRVVGEDLYSPIDWSTTATSATPVDKTYTKTLATRTYTKWLTIAAVAVKLQAKVELKAGLDIKAKAVAATGCNPDNLGYDASITARPWVNVHVVPEASVGIGVLQAGARGDIDLLEISAPTSGGVKAIGQVNNIVLQMRANSRVDIEALDGTLSVFIEACAPFLGCTDLASKQIYSWDGYEWQIPIFNYSKDIPINIFEAATRPATTLPGGPIVVGPILTSSR